MFFSYQLIIHFGYIESFLLLHGFSLVAVSRGFSLLQCTDFSLQWLLLLQRSGSGAHGLQQLRLTGSRAWAQQLWCTGLPALQHVGSSQTRDQTYVPCIDRWILNCWTTREVHIYLFQLVFLFPSFPISGFLDSSVGKESACNAGDPGSIPGLGRSPGERIGYPLQYSCASLMAQLVKDLPTMWETWV